MSLVCSQADALLHGLLVNQWVSMLCVYVIYGCMKDTACFCSTTGWHAVSDPIRKYSACSACTRLVIGLPLIHCVPFLRFPAQGLRVYSVCRQFWPSRAAGLANALLKFSAADPRPVLGLAVRFPTATEETWPKATLNIGKPTPVI